MISVRMISLSNMTDDDLGIIGSNYNILMIQVPSQICNLWASISLLNGMGLPIPAIMLTYAMIDIMCWLDLPEFKSDGNPTTKQIRSDFIRWCDKHIVHRLPGCRGIDLYAARCGLLHMLSTHSELVDNGDARSIGYDLSTDASGINPGDPLIINAIHLFSAAKIGAIDTIKSWRGNDDKLRIARSRLEAWPIMCTQAFDLVHGAHMPNPDEARGVVERFSDGMSKFWIQPVDII